MRKGSEMASAFHAIPECRSEPDGKETPLLRPVTRWCSMQGDQAAGLIGAGFADIVGSSSKNWHTLRRTFYSSLFIYFNIGK
ncbi:hypothetical protein ACSUZJ_03440 [Telluria sp. B2]